MFLCKKKEPALRTAEQRQTRNKNQYIHVSAVPLNRTHAHTHQTTTKKRRFLELERSSENSKFSTETEKCIVSAGDAGGIVTGF